MKSGKRKADSRLAGALFTAGLFMISFTLFFMSDAGKAFSDSARYDAVFTPAPAPSAAAETAPYGDGAATERTAQLITVDGYIANLARYNLVAVETEADGLYKDANIALQLSFIEGARLYLVMEGELITSAVLVFPAPVEAERPEGGGEQGEELYAKRLGTYESGIEKAAALFVSCAGALAGNAPDADEEKAMRAAADGCLRSGGRREGVASGIGYTLSTVKNGGTEWARFILAAE